MAATIKDIARKLNISVSTVSYALNNGPRPVPSELKERVLHVARELNYRPSRVARSMVTGRTFTIGVIPPSLDNDVFLSPYIRLALAGIANAAGARHQDMLVFTRLSGEDPARLADLVLDGRVDGALFVAPERTRPSITALVNAGFPTAVMASGAVPGAPTFMVDNEAGVAEVVRHLSGLGHRRIAHIAGRLDMDDGMFRYQAFRRQMELAGLPVPDEYLEEGYFVIDRGAEAMERLMRLPKPPTAVFCANDEIAIGAYAACRDLGVKVPDEVSIVGFDDSPGSAYITPMLTSVRQPLFHMAQAACEALIRCIEEEPCVDAQVFTPDLVIRDSTSRPMEDPNS